MHTYVSENREKFEDFHSNSFFIFEIAILVRLIFEESFKYLLIS